MQRWLKDYDLGEEAKALSRKDLFRKAHEKGLIGEVTPWFDFHDGRNKTTHVYDEDIAEEIYNLAKTFPPYLDNLISNLKEKT